jgi:hypothetical protein
LTTRSDTKLPIPALGEGGYTLLSKLGLRIGDQGDREQETSIRKVEEAIFWDGFRKQPTAAGVHKCYTNSRHIGIHLPEPDANVMPIAREESRDDYYPLIAQKPYCFFWRLDGTPDQLTDAGRFLLPWACHYTVAMKRNPGRAFATTSEVDELKSKESGR